MLAPTLGPSLRCRNPFILEPCLSPSRPARGGGFGGGPPPAGPPRSFACWAPILDPQLSRFSLLKFYHISLYIEHLWLSPAPRNFSHCTNIHTKAHFKQLKTKNRWKSKLHKFLIFSTHSQKLDLKKEKYYLREKKLQLLNFFLKTVVNSKLLQLQFSYLKQQVEKSQNGYCFKVHF